MSAYLRIVFLLFGLALAGMGIAPRHDSTAIAADKAAEFVPLNRNGNRLRHLDENNPWHPHRDMARLTTPQWVGESGVECVVVLAIDDMREPAKYETYLRPILNRLKQIDGRAPVSIMTCNVKPDDPQLASWLDEGLNFDVHTIDHPCPLLHGDDFAKAKSTYDRCVDLLFQIKGNEPVAFRMPCCDSLNTLSPRFYQEIFNQQTPGQHHLAINSSVFNLFTANDPSIPRDLVIDSNGGEKFRKYLPKGLVQNGKTFNTFTNFIEDYPYPYVINGMCWEFPCAVPSDWSAQHLQKPFNPDTVRDLKATLDITVRKQGVFNLVFHPHGWIKSEQIVELIDHAVATHGNKVKFLNFREALARLNEHALGGKSLRNQTGKENPISLVDVDADGYVDVVNFSEKNPTTRVWSPREGKWHETPIPPELQDELSQGNEKLFAFGVWKPKSSAGLVISSKVKPNSASQPPRQPSAWYFHKGNWRPDLELAKLFGLLSTGDNSKSSPPMIRFVDLNNDGVCELILTPASATGRPAIYSWDRQKSAWTLTPWKFPENVRWLTRDGLDAGCRFVDLDEDGYEDIVFSDDKNFGVYLFDMIDSGWSRVVIEGTRPVPAGTFDLPPIVRADGTDNGFFVHARHLFWQNEQTDKLPDLVDRRSFNEILAQAPDLPPKAKSSAAALASIRPRPGFRVELMAAEPLVLDPVSFAFGPDGKLWVVEMGDYPLGPKGGQVRVLEDVDGNGTFDKATQFLEVPYPTGVLPWKKGALVLAPPNLFYAEDTDGDGIADIRENLYTGFVEGNQQHRANGLIYGLDNWIYIANGDSGGMIRSVKTGKEVNISGRDLRIHPKSGDLDPVTGQTQFGRNRDDWGNWFGCNNANPMYQFVLEDAYQRRNPRFAAGSPLIDVPEAAGTAPVYAISQLLERFNDLHTANRFTSACSAMIYRDELFGPFFAGNAFISEPVHNLVHREVVSPAGVNFTSRRAPDEQVSEFLASSDNWFRPTTIKTGPDGALWIADMYRHVIEHPQWIPDTFQKKLDLRAGHDKGRIYRVYPIDQPPRAIPRLDRLKTLELVAALESPSGWQRDTVQQLVIDQRDPTAVPLLEKLAVESPRPETRVAALATLSGLGAISEKGVVAGLGDSHPGVRRQAVRMSENFAKQPSSTLLAKLIDLHTDADPHVRLQLAWTLGEFSHPTAAAALGKMLVANADDRFQFSALMSSVNNTNVEQVLATVLESGREAKNSEFLVVNLLDLAAALRNERALSTLISHATRFEGENPEIWQFTALSRLLDSLARRNETIFENLKKSTAPNVAEQRTAIERLFSAARRIVRDDSATVEIQVAAVRLLGRGSDQHETDLDILVTLLSPRTDPQLQSAAIGALGKLRDESIPKRLFANWRGLVAARRVQALDILLSRDGWAAQLASAVADEQVPRGDFDATRRQRLLNHRSADVRQKGAKAFAAALNSDRVKVIEQYRTAATTTGKAERGAALFGKNCSPCHRLAGVGYEVGPDLASLTDKSPEALLIAILDPNRAVEAKFMTYTAETKSGVVYTGLLANESGNSITLQNAEKKEQVILRADLEELVSTNRSVMPEGIEKDLSPTDVADIIAHVRSNVPLPTRKEFAGNEPRLVTTDPLGILVMAATNCEIYGTTLIFEAQHQNLGYWSNLDDHAVWQIEIATAGKYAVEFEWACDGSVAGNPWQLAVAEETLQGMVGSTGDWDTYRRAKVGEVNLPKGKQRIVLSPGEKPQGAMIDLKAIRLKLAK